MLAKAKVKCLWGSPMKGLLDAQEPFFLGDLIQMHTFTHFLHIFSWVTLIFSLPSLFPGPQTLYPSGFWTYLLECPILPYRRSNSASSPPLVSSLPHLLDSTITHPLTYARNPRHYPRFPLPTSPNIWHRNMCH